MIPIYSHSHFHPISSLIDPYNEQAWFILKIKAHNHTSALNDFLQTTKNPPILIFFPSLGEKASLSELHPD